MVVTAGLLLPLPRFVQAVPVIRYALPSQPDMAVDVVNTEDVQLMLEEFREQQQVMGTWFSQDRKREEAEQSWGAPVALCLGQRAVGQHAACVAAAG